MITGNPQFVVNFTNPNESESLKRTWKKIKKSFNYLKDGKLYLK